ncbi:dynamin family protein [Amphibiibacter pelophylacis]|uniref:Dynamin family protein n=1 Tax=Amphibiibacter pelophylacis TaxID=1799477 RepID=A0ACC6P3P4_9BURK
MTEQHVLDLSKRLHQWMENYSSEIEKDITHLRNKHAIESPRELSNAFARLVEENRLLQVGVVGRVKAGKSSLLNALIFDGHAILPRAATPMTAALTTLTYGESFCAEVEFYSESDQKIIELNAIRYEERLLEEKARAFESLSQRRQRSESHCQDAQFLADVEKIARRALQSEQALAAAHDQWQRIRNSGVDFKSLANLGRLEATDAQMLATSLLEYVSADGKYMPLTKSVDIFLPLDTLRNIRVIDTPGLNDPVQSREERTVALLKNCDVIFIVSPAGQFLSEQDIEVMSRITQKEGLQELVLIASQVDNQLYGSEIRHNTLQGALDKIIQTLSSHMIDTLQRLKVQQPEIGSTFDALIERGAGSVLHTSGMCHSLSVRLDQQSKWDSGERKAWDNLRVNYPDFFVPDNAERCHANLNLLANTEALRSVLMNVRAQKDRIIANRYNELISAKVTALEAFRVELLNFTQFKYQKIRSADISGIKGLKEQRRKMANLVIEGADKLDTVFFDSADEFCAGLKKKLEVDIEFYYQKTTNRIKAATSEKSESRTEMRDSITAKIANWAWGGGIEARQHTEIKVLGTQVRNGLTAFADELVYTLINTSKKSNKSFYESLLKRSTAAARVYLGDELDPALIIETNQNLIANLNIPLFKLRSSAFDSLNGFSGYLLGDDAKNFLDAAHLALEELRGDAESQVRQLIGEINESLPESYGKAFFQDMQARIDEFEEQVKNSLLTLDRLQRMAKELEAM